MKTKIFYMLAFVMAGAIIIGCDENNGSKEKTEEEKQTEKLSKTWVVDAVEFELGFDTHDRTDEWPSFEVTFTDGAFTTANSSFPDVWPAAGTWSYKEGDLNTIIRGDDVEIAITVSDSDLSMSFTYPAAGGRTDGIEGNWVFDMLVK